MECFTHRENQAIGICKSCGKALCPSCAVDSGFAVTCSEKCAKDAAEIHEMYERSKKIYGIGSPNKFPTGAIVWLLFGVIFLGTGVAPVLNGHAIEWFPTAMGIGSFAIAGFVYKRARDIGLQC